MELKIPVCALKGLELQDVKFNDESNCNAVAEQVGDHFHWVIDYNDCGTKKSVSGYFLQVLDILWHFRQIAQRVIEPSHSRREWWVVYKRVFW